MIQAAEIEKSKNLAYFIVQIREPVDRTIPAKSRSETNLDWSKIKDSVRTILIHDLKEQFVTDFQFDVDIQVVSSKSGSLYLTFKAVWDATQPHWAVPAAYVAVSQFPNFIKGVRLIRLTAKTLLQSRLPIFGRLSISVKTLFTRPAPVIQKQLTLAERLGAAALISTIIMNLMIVLLIGLLYINTSPRLPVARQATGEARTNVAHRTVIVSPDSPSHRPNREKIPFELRMLSWKPTSEAHSFRPGTTLMVAEPVFVFSNELSWSYDCKVLTVVEGKLGIEFTANGHPWPHEITHADWFYVINE